MIAIFTYYTGKNDNARSFAEEMESQGTADLIRALDGNLRYKYLEPLDRSSDILLISAWTDEEAIKEYYESPAISKLSELLKKYELEMKVERFALNNIGSDIDYKDISSAYEGRKEGEMINFRMSAERIRDILGEDAGISVRSMGLSNRAKNSLVKDGLTSLYDVIMAVFDSPRRLVEIRNMGRKSAIDVLDRLKEYGVEIPDEYDFVYDLNRQFRY